MRPRVVDISRPADSVTLLAESGEGELDPLVDDRHAGTGPGAHHEVAIGADGTKPQHRGLEPGRRLVGGDRTSVRLVAGQGMAETRQHRPDLMEPPGLEAHHDVGLSLVAWRRRDLHKLEHRRPPAAADQFGTSPPPLQIRPLQAEVPTIRHPLHPDEIGLEHATLGDPLGVERGRLWIAGEEQESLRDAIESMAQAEDLSAIPFESSPPRSSIRVARQLAGDPGRLERDEFPIGLEEDPRRGVLTAPHRRRPLPRSEGDRGAAA